MTKTSKIFYLAAAGVVFIAVIIVFLSNRGQEKQVAENYQPIEGAKASSYEPASGVLEINKDDNIIGSIKAPLKIFVYEDYASEYSADLAETLSKIASESDDKLVVIARPFVLSGSSFSREAALAVLCAKDVNKWEEMRALLLASAKEGGAKTDSFRAQAATLELNEEVFNTCLTNEEKSVKLEAVMNEAEKSLILGAPTMFVGDEMILGARPYNDFIDSNGDVIEGLKAVVERKLKGI